MATETRPGAPIWIDLTTPDPDAARTFYTTLFGWDYADGGEEFGHYNTITKGESPVGGLMKAMNMDGTPIEGAPASWNVYLKSDDVAATTEKVRSNGGSVLYDPMPVGTLGHMAEYSDPAGARIGAWQPGEFDGFELTLAPGTPVWFETMSSSYDACADFYRAAFGWDLHVMPGDQLRYGTNGQNEAAVAGICDATFLGDAPGSWRIYFAVQDTDATAEQIKNLGGAVLDGPMDSPFGRFATVTDPQGATFQIIQQQGQ